MNGAEHPEPLPAEPQRTTFVSVVALAWGLMCWAMLWTSFLDEGGRTSPFATADVALVCLIGVLPCGLSMARLARDLIGSSPAILGSVCWVAGVLALAVLFQQSSWISGSAEGVSGHILRPALALMLIAPSVWMWMSFDTLPSKLDSRRLAWLLTTWLVAFALPSTYVMARCRQDVAELLDLREQLRLGEASVVAHRLMRLAPGTQAQGQPVARLAADIDRSVRQLQAAVASVPLANASDDDWLTRARQLAMLGRPEAALQALTAIRIPQPNTLLLSATIHENREQWQQALDDYSRAQQKWEAQPNSPEVFAGRIQATTGIAYCLRKQGRYREAEQAYRQLLTLSPTADVYFLLAQFYEDTQQTTLARQHAQRAMVLAPDRFARSGQRLINKLTTMHFGCFKMLSNSADD